MGSPLRTLSSSRFLFYFFFCTFLVPKFFGCTELSIMAVFVPSLSNDRRLCSRPTLASQPQSSLCISCYLKMQDFYKKNVILYEDKRFCSTLYCSSAPPWTDNVADSNWVLPNHQGLGSKTLLFLLFLSSVNELSSVRPSIPGQRDREGGT